MRLALVVSDSDLAREAAAGLADEHDWVAPEQADTLVVVGGDGFLLHVLHQMLDAERLVPVFGLNRGTVGLPALREATACTSQRTVNKKVPT